MSIFAISAAPRSIRPIRTRWSLSAGTGVWTTTTGADIERMTWSTPVTWTDQSVGIENLVANEIIVPPGGNPVLASWDRPFFTISNLNAYPSTYGPVSFETILSPGGRSITRHRARVFSSASPTGGARSSRATRPTAARRGRNSQPKSPERAQATWEERSPPARRKTSSGRRRTATSLITLSMAARAGAPSRFPASRAGADSITPIISMQRTVTADRVLANTFYLYDPGKGVFKTTNGGQSWTNVHAGYIESNSSFAGYNSEIESVPGEASNLFYTGGPQTLQLHASKRTFLSFDRWRRNLDGRSQCARRLRLWFWRGGAGTKLSGHLHRRICQQRLWHLAIHQQRPVVDQYRDIPDRRA